MPILYRNIQIPASKKSFIPNELYETDLPIEKMLPSKHSHSTTELSLDDLYVISVPEPLSSLARTMKTPSSIDDPAAPSLLACDHQVQDKVPSNTSMTKPSNQQ